jgi:hypothetical protein
MGRAASEQCQMPKPKCQMKLEAPMTEGVVMALKHMDLNWHLDFDIWVC